MSPSEAKHPLDIAALDVAAVEFARAMDELSALQRRIDALQAERARRLVATVGLAERMEIVSGSPTAKTAEYVHRSTRAETALALGVSETVAERLLDEAALLAESMPRVLDAVEAGVISWRAASLAAECGRGVGIGLPPAAAAECRADYEDAALRLAAAAPPSRLRSRLMALRDRLLTTPPVERHRAAREERRLVLEDVEDGMSWLHAYLPSIEAHAVHRRLTDIARRTVDFDAEDGVEDGRTLDQRRVDLLVDFLIGDHVGIGGDYESRVAQGRDFGRFAGIRPTVVVTVPVQALLGSGDDTGAAGLDLAVAPGRGLGIATGLDPGSGRVEHAPPAMLDGIVPIDPVTARELTANAPSLYRLLVHPHTGARLDLSRDRYAVSTELRLWLRLRDETCRFPGCGRLAAGCDIDHTLAWQHGGETRADNLAHLCRGHHTMKHQTRWRIEQQPDGTITWCSPSGRIHSTKPAGAFAKAA